MEKLMEKINKIAIEAGKLSLNFYYKNLQVNFKKDKSIVSEADKAVEEYIYSKIEELIDNAGFIGEETMEGMCIQEKLSLMDELVTKEYIWTIDPIDGTNNYVTGYGDFAISIGLLKKEKSGFKPYMGVIYIPLQDTLYSTDGIKSFIYYNVSRGNSIIKELKYRNYSLDELERGIFSTYDRFVVKYNINKLRRFRVPGSMVYELAQTAKGSAIGTIAHASIWDVMAGFAIAKNVGVNVYDIETGKEKIEWVIEDFICNYKSSWKLKKNYIVANDIAKEYIFDNIIFNQI